MEDMCRKGVKRKHEEEGDEHHAWQRKSILDMSMGKLRTSPSRRGEPCLRRSVLILNTLKQIESELAQEGVHSCQSSEAALNEIPEMSMAQLTLDPLPDMSSFMLPLPLSPLSPVPMSVEAIQGEEGEGGDYISLADSGVVDLLPCKPVMTSQDQALSQTASSLYCSLPPQSSPALPFSASSFFYSSAALDTSAMSSSPIYEGSTTDIMPSTSMPLHAQNGLFTYPVYQLPKAYEVGGDSNNNSATQGPYSFSSSSFGDEGFTEAEVIEFLLETSDVATPSTSSPATSSASVLNTQCSTFCRSDSALDELDSIMQVLVGM